MIFYIVTKADKNIECTSKCIRLCTFVVHLDVLYLQTIHVYVCTCIYIYVHFFFSLCALKLGQFSSPHPFFVHNVTDVLFIT